MQQAYMNCLEWGPDLCVLGKNEVKHDDEITAVVSCTYSDDCYYNIEVQYVEEITIKKGQKTQIYFKAKEERIFNFYIPDDEQVTDIVMTSNAEEESQRYQMLVRNEYQNDFTAFGVHSAFHSGYVAKFYSFKNCLDCFCTGCQYQILLKATTEGYYNLKFQYNNETELLRFQDDKGIEIYDFADSMTSQCYLYNIREEDEKKDFRIKLTTYTGDPSIYVT